MAIRLLAAFLALPASASSLAAQAETAVVTGTVRDSLSGNPVPFVIVRLAGTEASALSTFDGRFRIEVPTGPGELELRKIGYRVVSIPIAPDPGGLHLDITMVPVAVELQGLDVRGEYEDPALRIIRRAIERKNDVLERIHDYRYQAYVRLIVRDLGIPEDSVASIVLLTETLTSAYWEQPDRYQEVITRRRQSSNLPAERNFVSVGQIVNFNKDRIDLEKYLVVSPTADDALAFYDYRVVDTLWEGTQMIYRLAVEPKSQAAPLFVGMLDIADSTYDVRAIDVGANRAVRFEFFQNLRYRQRMAEVAPDAWLPVEIEFSGELFIGLPLPGLPNRMSFGHTAVLEDYRFDTGRPPATLGEYLIVVDERADQGDSLRWQERRAIPWNETELGAWARIDSLERTPPSLMGKIGRGALGIVALANNEDFFHYNRVEGAYLGAGVTLRGVSPDLILRAKSGYGFERGAWQHRFGAHYRVWERQRMWLGAWYRDEVTRRPTLVSGDYNPTPLALLSQLDPYDYHRDHGIGVSLQTRVMDFVRLRLGYTDVEQTSLDLESEYALFPRDTPVRPNPPIVDGRLRSVSASIGYDSRRLFRQMGRDFYLSSFTYTQVAVGVEYADPAIIGNDFDFARYFFQLHRRQRTLNLGLTTLHLELGISSGSLPPQRYYTVDYGRGAFFEGGGFNTLNETNFSGNRAAMFHVNHNFDQLFRRTKIPLLRELPFTFTVHGGAFWTDFVEHTPTPGDDELYTAPTAYGEIGFGFANLTPWISPLNFGVWLTWQVSDYGTERFDLRVGVPGF